MKKKSDQESFRTKRCRLPPEMFAIGYDIPESPPLDPIEERIWHSIISFPDDVSIRTSDNHGTQLKAMYELWESWVYSIGKKDVIHDFIIYSSDEFQASIFNSMHGFYRVSASCLRTALEVAALGCCFQLGVKLKKELKDWQNGEIADFSDARKKIRISHRVTPLEEYLKKRINNSVFGKKGWTSRLHRELSRFIHLTPEYSLSAMWDFSNGPIYVPETFRKLLALYFETFSLSYIFVKLARPHMRLPQASKYIFARNMCEDVVGVRPTKVALYSYQFLWKKDFPWWDGKT